MLTETFHEFCRRNGGLDQAVQTPHDGRLNKLLFETGASLIQSIHISGSQNLKQFGERLYEDRGLISHEPPAGSMELLIEQQRYWQEMQGRRIGWRQSLEAVEAAINSHPDTLKQRAAEERRRRLLATYGVREGGPQEAKDEEMVRTYRERQAATHAST